ncbi:MAG: hypothetical protein ACOYMB_02770 [Patescibacteria group bacterium]
MKFKNLFFICIISLSLVAFFGMLPAQAADTSALQGLNATVDSTGVNKAALTSGGDIENKAANIIAGILSFVGVAFLILMIYGGILWMVSQGDTAQIKKAKDIIINGIIGLAIVIFAYAITSYLGKTITTNTSAPI